MAVATKALATPAALADWLGCSKPPAWACVNPASMAAIIIKIRFMVFPVPGYYLRKGICSTSTTVQIAAGLLNRYRKSSTSTSAGGVKLNSFFAGAM